MYDKQYIPKLADRLAYGGNKEIHSLVLKDMFRMKFDCRDGVKNFKKPVLIIRGRQDLTGDGVAYEAHLAFQNFGIVFVDKSGHYSWWEQSEVYKAEIETFLSRTQDN